MLRTHPGAHVSVPGLHFIPHFIPVVLTGHAWHITTPSVVTWATSHRVPIIINSICGKNDDTLTSSSGIPLKKLKCQLERLSVNNPANKHTTEIEHPVTVLKNLFLYHLFNYQSENRTILLEFTCSSSLQIINLFYQVFPVRCRGWHKSVLLAAQDFRFVFKPPAIHSTTWKKAE